MLIGITANNNNAQLPIKVEAKKLSKAEAIQICKQKYPKDFKRKKWLTLAIAIAALVLLIIPAAAFGLSSLSICSMGVGVLAVSPIAILGVSILIKKIDDWTLYWSGDLARILLQKKEEEAAKKAKAKAEIKIQPA